MKISELEKTIKIKIYSDETEGEINGVYVCDLLSRAMSKISPGDLWITIQNNVNTVAVAELTEAAVVVFPEGIIPADDVIKTASDKEIVIASSPMSAYEICLAIGNVL